MRSLFSHNVNDFISHEVKVFQRDALEHLETFTTGLLAFVVYKLEGGLDMCRLILDYARLEGFCTDDDLAPVYDVFHGIT